MSVTIDSRRKGAAKCEDISLNLIIRVRVISLPTPQLRDNELSTQGRTLKFFSGNVSV